MCACMCVFAHCGEVALLCNDSCRGTAQRARVASSDRLANEIWPPFQPGGGLSQQRLRIPRLGTRGTATMCMREDHSPTLPAPNPTENVALRYNSGACGAMSMISLLPCSLLIDFFSTVKITFSQLVKILAHLHSHPLTYPPRHLSQCCRSIGGG